MNKILFISVLLALVFQNGHATCTNSSNGSFLKLDISSLEYCSGDTTGMTIWTALGGTPLASACTLAEEGLTKYAGGVVQICKGTSWIDLKTCAPSSFTCLKNGMMIGSTVGPLICDSSYWTTMSDSCPSLACEYFNDFESCNTTLNECHWVGNSCINAQATCSSIFFASTCNATPPCEWSAGVCGTVY